MLPANRAFNSNGLALPGATAHLYESGGLTPANFYADSALSTSLGSTLTANGAGRFELAAYQDADTAFRLIVKDANGVQLDDVDPFYFGTTASGVPGADAENPNYTYEINTLSAGSSATLTATGTYPDITLTFGIPRGADGADGTGTTIADGDYGDITVSGTGTVFTIDAGTVTYAKMQSASAGNVVLARAASTSGAYSEVSLGASKLLGRGSTGNIAAITLGTGLSMSGTTLSVTSSGDPWTYTKLTSAFTGTASALESTGLTISSFSTNTYYEFEASFEAHVAAGSLNIALVWPANVTGAGQIQAISGNNVTSIGGDATATLTTANIGSAAPVPVTVWGYFYSGATAVTGSLDIQIKNASGSNTHTVGKGGFIKIRTI